MQEATGPMLSLEEFFTVQLDLDYPGLDKVREAVVRRDFPAACAAFASYVRSSRKPEVFFSIPYEKPENVYMRPGESEKEAAERICQGRLISCGVECDFGDKIDWFANPTYNEYREWTWQFNRHNEWKLLAHLYQQTGDERYAECFANQFRSWVRQAVRPDDVPGYATKCWRTIECGIRMGGNWPYVFHAFYRSPAFTDELLVDWVRSVYEHGVRLREHHMSGNWLIMEMNGLAQIGILYPELKQSAKWLRYAFDTLAAELDRQIYADGFQYELSTGYHDVVINNYQRLIHVAQAFGAELPSCFLPALENAASVDVKLMMPDGRLPDINDGKWHSSARLLAPKLPLFPGREDFQWVVTGGKEGKRPDYCSIALPYAGFLVMRTGWDPEAVWALFDAAPFGKAHQHEDKLSLLLFGGGRLLLTEGGNYAYDDSEMRRYVLSTRSHNTVRVDGQDQNRRKHYEWHEADIRRESGMRWRIERNCDFGEGVYDEGYGPDADRTVSHRRSVYFFKHLQEGLPPFLLVVDRFEGEGEHRFETLWHLAEESASLAHGRVTSAGMTFLTSRPDDGIALVLGETVPEWQGWLATGSVQGSYVATPTIRQSVTVKRAATVIVPCKAGECPIAEVKAKEDREDHSVTLLLTDGTELVLNELDYQ